MWRSIFSGFLVLLILFIHGKVSLVSTQYAYATKPIPITGHQETRIGELTISDNLLIITKAFYDGVGTRFLLTAKSKQHQVVFTADTIKLQVLAKLIDTFIASKAARNKTIDIPDFTGEITISLRAKGPGKVSMIMGNMQNMPWRKVLFELDKSQLEQLRNLIDTALS